MRSGTPRGDTRIFTVFRVTTRLENVYAMGDFHQKIHEMVDELYRIRDEIDAAIGHLKAAIEEPADLTQSDTRRSPSKKGAAEWTEELLRKVGNEPTHYHEIARQIIHGGYQGVPRSGEVIGSEEHVDRIAHSLSGTLNREKSTFEAIGSGRFRLRNFQNS